MLLLRIASSGLLLSLTLGLCFGVDVPRVRLNLHQSVQVGLAKSPFQTPVKCDPDGNLYLRLWQNSNPLRAPITKIGPDGKVLAEFSFDHVGDLDQDLQADDFVVGNRGEVYALVEGSKGRYVVTFRSDGKFLSAITLSLSQDLGIYRLARLVSGNFLLTALKGEAQEPRTLILDESGNIAKFIDIKETLRVDHTGKISPEDMHSFEMSDMVMDETGTCAFELSLAVVAKIAQAMPVPTPFVV